MTGQVKEYGRVLVVDDSLTNRMVIGSRLEALGHSVTTASNGVEAIEQVLSQSFDLILMDLLMPELSGAEVIRYLRANKVTIPIVAITSKTDEVTKQQCLSEGFDVFLSKSFTDAELYAALASFQRRSDASSSVPSLVASQELSIPDCHTENKAAINVGKLWDLIHDAVVIHQITTGFLQDNIAVMDALATAVQNEETDTIYALSHRLKGSSGLIQAIPLSKLAGQLEVASQGHDKILKARLLRSMQLAFAELEKVLASPDWLTSVLEDAGG